MDQLEKQIARARRRLVLEQFLAIVSWTLCGSLLASGVGLAIWRIKGPEALRPMWEAWLIGGLVAGLALALVITYFVRRGALDAALEIDRRYGLKERISSTLALGPEERQSEAGQALIADALHKAERIDVADQFKVRASWGVALRLAAASVFFAALLVPVASTEKKAQAASSAEQEQTRKSTDALRKKLEQRKRELLEKGLTDASDLLKKVDEDLSDLNKSEATRKESLIRINDLASEIAERRKQLGSGAEVKKQLQQLKDMESGPADEMVQALQDGDLGKAADAMKALKEKLENGELSDSERAQLSKQLDQMQKKLEQMRSDHEQAKQQLKDQIEQRKAAGDLEGASKLQQKLDALQEMESQMGKMGEMANKLQQASQALENADVDLAAQSLDELLDQLSQMQSDLDAMEVLGELLDDLNDGKNAMNCPHCNGAGCSQCQSDNPGEGRGEGKGKGERPEEQTDTGAYNSRVRADLQKGAATKIGIADGPNRAGLSREEAREQIDSSVNNRADAVNQQQRLPRDHRDHVGEYFERLKD